eukprot:TRINITY_DN6452_c0_g1_i1.p1 TRINITY_DN6452_c0_g1~~TRINITY_DN6452_c0_g1_i1.p1  ORF type:complete len:702 (+),score=146.96 TRINITY_DN6452_c0_g1_i1:38-2143(+)
MEEEDFGLACLPSPREGQIFDRFMKQLAFTLDLKEDIFKSQNSNDLKLKEIGYDFVADLLIPLLASTNLTTRDIAGLVKTIKAKITSYGSDNEAIVEKFFGFVKLYILRHLNPELKPNIIHALANVFEVIVNQDDDLLPTPPLIQVLLSSQDDEDFIKVTKALHQFTALYCFKMPANTTTLNCGSAFNEVEQFLKQLDVDFVDPEEILGCSDQNMQSFFALFFTKLQSCLNLIEDHSRLLAQKAWHAFIHRINLDPYLSQLFYWLATSNSLLGPLKSKLDIQLFIRSPELIASEEFFTHIQMNWDSLASSIGHKFSVRMTNPLNCEVVKEWEIVKIFDSKAKPYLLKLTQEDGSHYYAICKRGDDLRHDSYIQTLFSVFNDLWSTAPIPLKPFIHTYKCLPVTDKFGLVECVSNVSPVIDFDWEGITDLGADQKDVFICSLAGSYLASFVLGIRDRHEDNMLMKNKHIFFHIDFSHLWNNAPLLDAPRIAIPDGVKSALSAEEWKRFESVIMDGFLVLHKAGKLITNTAITLFKYISDASKIEEFIQSDKSLMLDCTPERALCQFREAFLQSFGSLRTKIKNSLHKMGKDSPDTKTRSTRSYSEKHNSNDPRTPTNTLCVSDTSHSKAHQPNEGPPRSGRLSCTTYSPPALPPIPKHQLPKELGRAVTSPLRKIRHRGESAPVPYLPNNTHIGNTSSELIH